MVSLRPLCPREALPIESLLIVLDLLLFFYISNGNKLLMIFSQLMQSWEVHNFNIRSLSYFFLSIQKQSYMQGSTIPAFVHDLTFS